MTFRRPKGSWSELHSAAIERAIQLQAHALSEVLGMYATDIDVDQLTLDRLTYDDIVDLLDGVKNDPEARMRLDNKLRELLVPALQEALAPPQQQGAQQ